MERWCCKPDCKNKPEYEIWPQWETVERPDYICFYDSADACLEHVGDLMFHETPVNHIVKI